MDSAAAGECAFHPGRPAVEICSSCAAPLCRRCLREGEGGALCPDCHAFLSPAPSSPGRMRGAGRGPEVRDRPAEEPVSAGGAVAERVPWSPWPGVLFLPLPLLLMVWVTWLVNQGGGLGWGTPALLISLLLYGVLLAFTALQLKRWGRPLRMLGWRREGLVFSLLGGALAGAAAFGLNFALLNLTTRIMGGWGWLDRWLRGLLEIRASEVPNAWDLVVTVLVVLLLAPFCEEVYFRGYLYPAMRGRMSLASAVLFDSFLFSLVHFGLYGIPGRLALGAVFCLLYEYSGNLAAPVAAHAVNNFLALLVPLIP